MVALGEFLYISKFGNGGMLLVSYLPDVMKFFECDYFAKMKPDIVKYKSFYEEHLPSPI